VTGTSTVCCHGKLPLFGDFVRLNGESSPCLGALDRWLMNGIESGYAQAGRAFESKLRSFEPMRVVLWGGADRCWTGLVVPSADAVGRVYPFTFGWELQGGLPLPELMPLFGFADMLALSGLVERSRRDKPPLGEFLAELGGMRLRPDAEVSDEVLGAFLRERALEELCRDWPDGGSSDRLSRSLHELSLLGQPPFPPRYLTRIPYSGEPAEVGFWLKLITSWMPDGARPTLLAWPAAAGAPGDLRVLYDRLEARYLGQALWPAQEGGAVLDLARAASASRPTPGYEAFASAVPVSASLRELVRVLGDF